MSQGDVMKQTESLLLRGIPTPQSHACDACSLGVMDAENPHMWDECHCQCHGPSEAYTGTCQRCGAYWDVRLRPICPCGGEVL